MDMKLYNAQTKELELKVGSNKNFRKHSLEEVKDYSSKLGFIFLDEKYEGVNHRHYFKCTVHNKISKATYKDIHKGLGLRCCKGVREAEKATVKEDYVIERLLKRDIKLLDTFTDIKKKHMVKCLKHNKIELSTLAKLLNKTQLHCCVEESMERKKKVKIAVKIDPIWALCIRWVYANTCRVCRLKDLSNENYKSIYLSPSKEGNLDGVLMCKKCAVDFGKSNGFKDNTTEQFEQFYEEYSGYRNQWCDIERLMWFDVFKSFIDKNKERIEEINKDIEKYGPIKLMRGKI